MDTKDLIGLNLALLGTVASIVLMCAWPRIRGLAFFWLVAGTVVTDKLSINFFSHYWYRGTTRGIEFTVLDALAIGMLVSLLLFPPPGQKRWYWPGSLALMLVFFLYACGSVMVSEPRVYGVFELSRMIRGLVFFVVAALFVRSERELSILVFGLCCAACVQGALAVKERVFEGVDRVTGTLDHANSLSMYLCLIGPIFVAAANSTLPRLVRWFSIVAIAATAVGSLLTVSRAGVPIFGLVMLGATVMCVSWRITLKKVAATALIALCIGGLFYKAWPSLKARYEEATLEEEYLDKQGEGRGYYLRLAKAIMQDRFFGIGLNNWSYWVSKKYGARIGTAYEDYDLHPPVDRETWSDPHFAAPAHNLGALTVGELGVPGLILFGLMWARWFGMGSRFLWQRTPAAMQRLGVGLFFGTCGISLQSLTEWTYRQTHIYMTFHILLGALASLYYARCRSRRQPATAPVEAVSSPKYEFADAVAGRC